MITVCQIDTIKGATKSLADILGNLKIIIGIIARKPTIWEIVHIRKGSIKCASHDGHNENEFKNSFFFHIFCERAAVESSDSFIVTRIEKPKRLQNRYDFDTQEYGEAVFLLLNLRQDFK